MEELLLDFLFDMQHEEVFDKSPYKTDVEKGLLDCPIAAALVKKAEYYWQRNEYPTVVASVEKDLPTAHVFKRRRMRLMCEAPEFRFKCRALGEAETV